MRFFFTGPRIFGIRPGISLGASDFRKISRPTPARSAMRGSFVYVVQGPGNHHKIGVSTDPIARLAQLQTGSHQALDFAYIGVTPGTGYNIERTAHEILAPYRQTGEWFAVPASIAIGSVIEAAMRVTEQMQQVSPEMVPQIIYQASRSATPPPLPSKGMSIGKMLALFLAPTVVVLFAMLCVIAYFAPPPH